MGEVSAQQLEREVWASLELGDLRRAIVACERLNTTFPEFASGWHASSQLALHAGNPAMALNAVRRAIDLEPDNPLWFLQQARCFLKLGQMEELADVVEPLLARTLPTAYENAALGLLLTELGRREEAIRCYEKAAALEPGDARHKFNIACLQRTLGRLDEAEGNFDKTVELDPEDYEAYKLRSELRKATPDRNHVEQLESVLAAGPGNPRGEVNICYALAKELEDLGEPARAFRYLEEGARKRRALMRYDVGRDLATMDVLREVFVPEVLAQAAAGHDSAEPIFVLGMPRTGTTLVERILGTHSEVLAAGELPNFAVEMMRLVRAQVQGRQVERDELVRLSANIDFARLGETYVESTRPQTGRTARFVDKMPLNYLYVGLIHRALPNAKIIRLARDPLDTCYAIYKTLFIDAYPFSYNLEELARYFVAYEKLMAHWQAVLPGVMCEVRYEDLVRDVEGESRKLLERCGLEWQPGVLDYHASSEASTTASAVQVRQPVYTSSIGRWRDYEQELQPVVDILRDAGLLDDQA